MKRFLICCLLMFLFPGAVFYSRASHIFGGELLYTYISGNQYKVTLTLYGDCSAASSIFSTLTGAQPIIYAYNNNTLFETINLIDQDSSGVEVSPVCPAQISQTYCNGGTLPGVKRFIYSNVITLSGASANWKFIFDGSFYGSSTAAGRSSRITNIVTTATTVSVMQIEATLNNLNTPNSNPQYSTIPTPFYCINVPEQYNQGATDPNGDSLSFALVPAIDASSNASVSYVSPYTATNPLSTSSGGFTFSSLNGQMSFTPNILQDALIVNQVSEYRNGVLVGASEREMTFIVLDGCNGTPPSPTITNLNGALVSTTSTGNIINICKGAPMVSFDIVIANPDGDTTFLTSGGLPSGATLTINNGGTPNPSAHFSWATDTISPGIYSFFVTIKNNHCPISNTQTVAYTIQVVNFPTITETLIDPTHCIHKAAVQYNVNYGFSPRTINVIEGGTIIRTIIDTTGNGSATVITDSLTPGNYVVTVSSDTICTASYSFTITDSGSLAADSANFSLCVGDPSATIRITPAAAGATINYFNLDGSALSAPPVVNTTGAGTYNWYYIENYLSCTSGQVPMSAVVHNLPDAQIIDIPQTVCYGDQVYLKATGGVQYAWSPFNLINSDTGGQYAIILAPATFVVSVTDQYNCTDTASVTYSDIQQCCNFSFPNAFTPNNDGRNDGFKVVTYGNMQRYALTIFDRFGEMVFYTNEPKQPWDGTFHGQPCEVGTYYYFLQAQCLTGPKEFYKGDVTLIR